MPEDPKEASKFMKRFKELTGMEEMLSRMERGEDVEKLEEELEGMDEEDLMKEFFEIKNLANIKLMKIFIFYKKSKILNRKNIRWKWRNSIFL